MGFIGSNLSLCWEHESDSRIVKSVREWILLVVITEMALKHPVSLAIGEDELPMVKVDTPLGGGLAQGVLLLLLPILQPIEGV